VKSKWEYVSVAAVAGLAGLLLTALVLWLGGAAWVAWVLSLPLGWAVGGWYARRRTGARRRDGYGG
jgi:hypothetical protein